MQLNRFQRILLSLLSGILLYGGWAGGIWQWLTLIGFVPLLVLEEYFSQNRYKSLRFFGLSFLTFFVWNALSTWWILNATMVGALLAIVFNSLFMAIVAWFFHLVKRKTSDKIGYTFFIVSWIAFEYLHYNWNLSWTWMTLGNSLSENTPFIQWYEYTGVLGGSLWILLLNVLLTWIVIQRISLFKISKKTIFAFFMILVIPIILSLTRYFTYKEKGVPIEVVIVQPNIDPYNDKFSGMSEDTQLNRILSLAQQGVTAKTNYVVGPETALPQGIWEEDYAQHPHIQKIISFCKQHSVSFIIGATTFRMYKTKITPTSRPYDEGKSFYDTFNSALQIDSNDIQTYHKSELVLGVERMPFPSVLGFLEDLSLDLGGTSGSLGTQDEPSIFHGKKAVAPAVCYESIYGEYLSKFVKLGAEWVAVITNDGWWKDTPGYRQHLSYSRIRAIELRRDIARSANTGISCFINQKGDFVQQSLWWTPAYLRGNVYCNNKKTFYVVWGDLTGRVFSFITVLILIWTIVNSIRKKTS